MFHSRQPARRPTSWLNRRPRFEVLEDRTVPSTLYVDDSLVADTPLGSLPASVHVSDDRENSGNLRKPDAADHGRTSSFAPLVQRSSASWSHVRCPLLKRPFA